MKQNRKLNFCHGGLGAPTSFLPRVARGRMKEGELRISEVVCGEKKIFIWNHKPSPKKSCASCENFPVS